MVRRPYYTTTTKGNSDMTPEQFREKLTSVTGFKEKVVQYLEKLIKLDFDWAPEVNIADVCSGTRSEHPAYDFPRYAEGIGDRSMESWLHDFHSDAKGLAVKTQVQQHPATCLKKGKGKGCRFGFGGDGKALVPETRVNLETGAIDLARHHPKVNNHNPVLAAVTRSNHDIKTTFTSGYQNLSSMYYMTAYVAKNENDISDLVALEESWKDVESRGLMQVDDLMERMRRLMIRINYTRSYSRQFSGAQVAAMLLNIGKEGTHYCTSTFSSLNLFAVIHFLVENAPQDYQLMVARTLLSEDLINEDGNGSALLCLIVRANTSDLNNDSEETMERTQVETGQFSNIPAVVENYIYRGRECDDMSLYEMTMETEVKPMTAAQWEKYTSQLDSNKITAGRHLNQKARFLPPHSKERTHWICFYTNDKTPVVYGAPYNCVRNSLSGPTFPRRDDEDPDRQETRAMLLLILFKEWRQKGDLKGPDDSWLRSLQAFEDACGNASKDEVSLLQQ